ncbi:hypothetical protein [Streptomyces sp. S1]|uniref:hypothetical protein n=1 Tax=Streptomyces sp. S1 TaxID=718288 RepID=UPI003D7140CA
MNVELAKKVRALIKKYPERHDQSDWSSDDDLNPAEHCGTSACIAGWVAAAKGYTLSKVRNEGWTIDTFARDALDLSPEDSFRLFYTFDNAEALQVFDDLIAEAEGTS